MPYEIPQQLQYEEKIIFGLTFRQLMYVVIFILPALIIFTKTNWSLIIKIPIGSVLVGIASLFMFFNFAQYIRRFLSWIAFREAWLMQPIMIQFLSLEKVENGVVYVWKKSKPIEQGKEKRSVSAKTSNPADRADKLHDSKRAGKRRHQQ